jgi:hypothetical protein
MKNGKFKMFAFVDEASVEIFESFEAFKVELDDPSNRIYYVEFEVEDSEEAVMQIDLLENDYGIVFNCEHENEVYSKDELEEVFN